MDEAFEDCVRKAQNIIKAANKASDAAKLDEERASGPISAILGIPKIFHLYTVRGMIFLCGGWSWDYGHGSETI